MASMRLIVRSALPFVGGLGAGAVAAYIVLTKGGVRESTGEKEHSALKYGKPSEPIVRTFTNFVVEYDPRLRNPKWVLEHIHRDRSHGPATRDVAMFYEDEEIDERFRSRMSDFRGSGYDRGHMAPAANHKSSQESMQETFSLTNIAPQVGAGFNRDYWARFERFIKTLTNSCEDVYIVTGPLYLPQHTGTGYQLQHPMLGDPPRMVAVPTHFFKVVLGEKREGQGQRAVAAWVMPNAAIDPDIPLTAFTVPIAALEDASGLRFFQKLLTGSMCEALDRAALSWQQDGLRRYQQLRGSPPPPSLLLEPLQDVPTLKGEAREEASPGPSCEGSEQLTVKEGAAKPMLSAATAPDIISLEEGEAAAPRELSRSKSVPGSPSPHSTGGAEKGAGALPDEIPLSEKRLGRKRRHKQKAAEEAASGPRWLPGWTEGQEALHVCDAFPCQLPAADWYLASKRLVPQVSKGGKGSAGGASPRSGG